MGNECPMGLDTKKYEIFFEDLSENAQMVALEHKGVSHPGDVDWDCMPMAHIPSGVKSDYAQFDLDLQALTSIGCFNVGGL